MRKFILFSIFILFWGCSFNKIDEKKLSKYIKENFSDYELLEKPIIGIKYKNLAWVVFARAGKEGLYGVVLSHKGNKFQIVNIKKGNEIKKAIFTVGEGDEGKYKFDIMLGEKLIVYEHSIYGKKDDYCDVKVYRFDKNENLFVFDEKESINERENYCYKICQKIEVDSRVCNPEVDMRKLTEFIKNNFGNYKLLKQPIILDRYRNLLLVRFSSDYKGVVLLYKGNDFKVLKIKRGNEEENAIFKTAIGKQVGSRVMLKGKTIIAYDYSLNNKNDDYCDIRVYDFDSEKEILIPNREAKDIENSACMAICSAVVGNWERSPICSKFLSPELQKEDWEKFYSFVRGESPFATSVDVVKFRELFIASGAFYGIGPEGSVPLHVDYYVLKYKDNNIEILKRKEGNSYRNASWAFSVYSWEEVYNNYYFTVGIDEKFRYYAFSPENCEVGIYTISGNELLLDESRTSMEKEIYCKVKKVISSIK